MKKEEKIQSAAELYEKLKGALEPQVFGYIKNYRDIVNPVPAVLLATLSTGTQCTVQSAVTSCLASLYPGIKVQVESYGMKARRALVIKGVPVDVQEDAFMESNVGMIKVGSVKRMVYYKEGMAHSSTTVMLEAATDEAARDMMAKGVKAGFLLFNDVSVRAPEPILCFVCTKFGHPARECPSEKAQKINFNSSKGEDFYCYKCDTFGHRFRMCSADIEPTCGNCDQESKDYKPHWPTDAYCPARIARREPGENQARQTWTQIVASESSIAVDDNRKRIAKLEKHASDTDQKITVQSKAIRDNRKVIGDVALVATQKKKELMPQTERRIMDWWAMEKALHAQESKVMPSPVRRSKRKSSLQTLGEKKMTRQLFTAEAMENLYLEGYMSEDE